MIITIDGPSGTGKSSAAKKLAKRLGYHYYNTGALYRALTAWMLKSGNLQPEDLEPNHDFQAILPQVKVALGNAKGPDLPFQEGDVHYWVQHEDMTASTQDQALALLVSRVSSWACVRKHLLTIQRELGAKGQAIFDGRDMGTVVFPGADLKVFLTARADVRAKRRHLEMVELAKQTGIAVPSEAEICQQILERDLQDTKRTLAPLRASDEAHIIDASELTLDQVVEQIADLVNRMASKR